MAAQCSRCGKAAKHAADCPVLVMRKATQAHYMNHKIGDTVKDKRTGRIGTIVWASSTNIANDMLFKLTDVDGEWTAYARQVEAMFDTRGTAVSDPFDFRDGSDR